MILHVSSFLGTELMSFSLTAMLKYFVFQYHYIYRALPLLFLSSNILVALSKQMPIPYFKAPHSTS